MSEPVLNVASLRIERDAEPPRRRGRALWALPVVGLLGGGGWLLVRLVDRPMEVEVASVFREAERRPGTILTAGGYVIADPTVAIAAKVSGRVELVGPREGDRVKKGQVLLRLDDGERRAQLALARANRDQARRDLERTEKLAAGGFASPAERDDVRSRVEVTEAQLQLAEAALAYTAVGSPIDGTVISRKVEVGEVVNPGVPGAEPLLRVADLDRTYVEIDLQETDLGRLKQNQRARVRPDAYPERSYEAQLEEISPAANRQKGTVRLKVRVAKPDPFLRVDMAAKVEMIEDAEVAAQPPRTIVPRAALRAEQGRSVAYVVRGGVLWRRNVTPGEDAGTGVEVRDGLAAGDEVVVKSAVAPRDGQKVRIAGREP
jgi:HlyD family secretion protein